MDYIEEAKKLVRNLDQRMGPSPYDIAWMARVKGPDGGPRWPELIEWLLQNQRPDGSWGGEIEYYHDRIISTLAAIIAIKENGSQKEKNSAISAGEQYLWQNLHRLPLDPFELSGFELIFPTLLDEARKIGLDVPTHACGYEKIQTRKLRLIPPQMLYSPSISTVYSLEFLGSSGNSDKIKQAITTNGSVGNSPATTSYFLTLSDDNNCQSFDYLEAIRKRNRIITVYPFRTFELSWVLNNLIFSGETIDRLAKRECFEILKSRTTSTGTALDPTFGVTDGDITSVCCHVLASAGLDVNPMILKHFEDENSHIFHTYEYERNISMSTNIHALDALNLIHDYPNAQEVKQEIIITLLNNRQYNIYWTDKWHASPYYTTSHAIITLLQEGRHLVHACQPTIDWLIHTQYPNGSWGFFQEGTAEETSYALLALLHYHKHDEIREDIFHRGAEYLVREYGRLRKKGQFPELWLAKSIYAPYSIISSAIISSLILYRNLIS
jgi:halimadienyl-diphosphate synthase